MEKTIFKWMLDIPQVVGKLANWLTTDINIGSWSITPLGILGVSGVAVLVGLIGYHIVRLII